MTAKQAKPTCTITLKNWSGYKRMTISGRPVLMDIKRPSDNAQIHWDYPMWFPIQLPIEINMTLAVGTEKVRMWP